eukprot:scaffold9982_cov63-Phaeocystis_antarctica.AAC.2
MWPRSSTTPPRAPVTSRPLKSVALPAHQRAFRARPTPEPFERAVERPDPLDSPGTHKPGLVAPPAARPSPRSSRLDPLPGSGARSPAGGPHTNES